MSTFGDNTFKQAVYEEIQWRMKDGGMYTHHAVQEIMEICSYMLAAIEYGEIYEKAYEDAKAEILVKLA